MYLLFISNYDTFQLFYPICIFANILILIISISMYHVVFVYCSVSDDVLCEKKKMFCYINSSME